MGKGKDISEELSGMLRGVPPQNILIAFDDKPAKSLADLKEQMEKRISIRREITQKIEQMQDETEKTVLRLRYIHWLRWEQIAERMGYSPEHVQRIHKKALGNFKMS